MQANRALAHSLMLEFSQSAVRSMGPIEHESLAALAELGFRFSLDRLTDLRIEPRELADAAFRFVKAPAALLLNRATTQAIDIHPADLSDLLGTLRHRSHRRPHRERGDGRRPARLRRAVRAGLPVLAAAPGPQRGPAGVRRAGRGARARALPSPSGCRGRRRKSRPPTQPAEPGRPGHSGETGAPECWHSSPAAWSAARDPRQCGGFAVPMEFSAVSCRNCKSKSRTGKHRYC